MPHNCLLLALRAPRAASVQLPLFLVPSFAGNAAPCPPQSCHRPRSYANYAKLPKTTPQEKRDPTIDPNASRKHLKPDFPMTTKPRKRDMNKKRGVSVMRSTGPRKQLSVAKYPLPVPVTDPETLKERLSHPMFTDGVENHGLWGFFYDKKAMIPPDKMSEHGREWTYAELSSRTFEELHKLYWVAHKDLNRIATNAAERRRVHAGYGDSEDQTRTDTVEETMRNIREVLRDRYESTEESIRILDSTPLAELDLNEKVDTFEKFEDMSEVELAETSPAGEDSPARDSPPALESPPKLRF